MSIKLGTKLKVWRQGQFYPELGQKIIELPYQVNPGPSDHQIKIDGVDVQPDEDGNFLMGNYSELELDAIHTYGTARVVIDSYEKSFKKSILWSWQQLGEKEPLSIRIRNNDINSRFLAKEKCIELDYYGQENNRTFNCRTIDLIAHEIGHAIINSLCPEWQNGDSETRGIEEAFCDLSAMFLLLSQVDLCEHVIKETKGDLTRYNILALFGVGHGYEGNSYKEIRNAINSKTYVQNHWNSYTYCEVLVGVLYEILADLFSENETEVNMTIQLFEVGRLWKNVIIETFLKVDSIHPNMKEFASIFEELMPDHRTKIRKRFAHRNVH